MGYGIYKNMHVYFKNYWIWQLVLDGVVDMDVGYKCKWPGFKASQWSFSISFLYYTVKLD